MKKKSICTSLIRIIVISILVLSCQGLNDNKIDPVLLDHAKAVIDFDSLRYSPYLQVVQHDCKTAWLYLLSSFDGSIWFSTGKSDIGKGFELPTDLIEYKGKYILFYLRNKKPLNRDLLAKTLNLKRDEYVDLATPDPLHTDTRMWYYFKDKYSNKSVYNRFDRTHHNSYTLPEIRYFLCNGQDSAVYYSHIIDMQSGGGPDIYGIESKKGKFSNLNQIKFWVKISNRTDSALYINTRSEEYGHFVVRNGENSLSCNVIDTIGVNEVSPGMYEIAPHAESELHLSTEKKPIVFEKTSHKQYPDKIYQLVHDSIYYIPTHIPPKNEKRHIWNKNFKIYFSYLSNYNYYIDDMEYIVNWDGEINEYGRKVERK